jgi:hypothetical protein
MRMPRGGAILATGVLAVTGALALGGQASAETSLQHPHRAVAATSVAPSIHSEVFGGYYYSLGACQSDGQWNVSIGVWDSYECLQHPQANGKNWALWGFIS